MFGISIYEIMLVFFVAVLCGRKEELNDAIKAYRNLARQAVGLRNALFALVEDVIIEAEKPDLTSPSSSEQSGSD